MTIQFSSFVACLGLLALAPNLQARNMKEIPLTEAWKNKVTAQAPEKPQAEPKKERKGIKDKKKGSFHDQVRYMAWVKSYKKGRVFFSSPSHNAQSFERPELLGFLLNGMQYAIGDLECEDAPMEK